MFKTPMAPGQNGAAPKHSGTNEFALAELAPHSQKSRLLSPIMLLTGHDGEIYAARFSQDGTCLASAGYDMKILLWNAFGECENFSTLKGHTGSVMDLGWSSDSSHLFTCATDTTVRSWDMETGACLRKFKTHSDIVNSCHPARRGPELVVSAGDAGKIIVHDTRRKEPVYTAENPKCYPITAVTFNDTSDQVIAGGVDNTIRVWDLRRNAVVYTLSGHSDIITGLALSPDGGSVLSNAMDCTARIWDIRPFVTSQQRCLKTFTGHQHSFEKNLIKCGWSHDGSAITCGSSDRYAYVWAVHSCNILYKLPGHQGSVNACDFHPQEQMLLLSAGSDKRIFLGELAA